MKLYEQCRRGTQALIKLNPVVITPMRRPLIDDGFGGLVLSGTAVAQAKARIRISHESSGVARDSLTPSGLDTSLSLFALTDFNAPLEDGDTFEYDGFTWTAGPVNTLKIAGRVYSTEAPLVKGTAVSVTIPTDFLATALSDTAIDLAWTDVGAVNTYSIERKTGTAAFAVIASPAAGVLVFHDTGLTAETAYTYRIRAYSGATPSLYSPETTATTEETPS